MVDSRHGIEETIIENMRKSRNQESVVCWMNHHINIEVTKEDDRSRGEEENRLASYFF